MDGYEEDAGMDKGYLYLGLRISYGVHICRMHGVVLGVVLSSRTGRIRLLDGGWRLGLSTSSSAA